MKKGLVTLIISFFIIISTQAEIVSGKAYKINSCSMGGKALFMPNASLDEKVDVITWVETNVPAQRWIANTSEGNFFYLANAYSEKLLTNYSHRPNAGNKIYLRSDDREYAQWEFIPVEDTNYPNAHYIRFSKLSTGGKNLYLEITDDADGSLVYLQEKRNDTDSIRQMWMVIEEDVLPNRVTPELRNNVMQGWKNNYFNILKNSTGFWGEAEMMETILDAYETTGKQEYRTMFEQVYEHFVSYPAGWYQPGNGQDWRWNEFNDDIAWAVLASVRAYLMFGEHPNSNINYLTIAKKNYDWMYERALLPSGMLRWKESPAGNQGTNSCINGPAQVAACYLAIATNDDSYYETAKDLYALQRRYLYDAYTGKVFDSGSWNNGSFTVGNYWVSTYNQGTFLGAALMLYNRYGTAQYLNDAHKIAEWTRQDLCNTYGVIRVCGGLCGSGGDLQGFKGILMRYLRRYVVDLALPDKVEWLQRNALHAYNNRNSKGVIWTAWWEKTSEQFLAPDGCSFDNQAFGTSTAVSAAFNAPLDKNLIIKNAYETIEAEHFDYLKGVFVEQNGETAIVGNIASNYFTAYNNVDFGTEKVTRADFLVQGSRQSGRQIEIRLDSPSGTVIGTAEIPSVGTGEWVTVSCPIANVEGKHNIYLVYKGAGFKLDNFRFTSETSGVKNPNLSAQLLFYPNPVIDNLTVEVPQAGRLYIFNSLGDEINAVNVLEGTKTLNVSNLEIGVYILRLHTNVGVFSVKFFKNKI